MPFNRVHVKHNCTIGKNNADGNCWCKRGTWCDELRCLKWFYPDGYAQGKIIRITRGYESYRSASIYASGNEPEVYVTYIVYENGLNVLYVQVLKYIYGMLVAYLLCYKKSRSDIEK